VPAASWPPIEVEEGELHLAAPWSRSSASGQRVRVDDEHAAVDDGAGWPVRGWYGPRFTDAAWSGSQLALAHPSGVVIVDGEAVIAQVPAAKSLEFTHAGRWWPAWRAVAESAQWSWGSALAQWGPWDAVTPRGGGPGLKIGQWMRAGDAVWVAVDDRVLVVDLASGVGVWERRGYLPYHAHWDPFARHPWSPGDLPPTLAQVCDSDTGELAGWDAGFDSAVIPTPGGRWSVWYWPGTGWVTYSPDNVLRGVDPNGQVLRAGPDGVLGLAWPERGAAEFVPVPRLADPEPEAPPPAAPVVSRVKGCADVLSDGVALTAPAATCRPEAVACMAGLVYLQQDGGWCGCASDGTMVGRWVRLDERGRVVATRDHGEGGRVCAAARYDAQGRLRMRDERSAEGEILRFWSGANGQLIHTETMPIVWIPHRAGGSAWEGEWGQYSQP
jgi:hypothetical protein